MDIRKYGSQGQQRTSALSLKLSEISLVKKNINRMEWFDAENINKLESWEAVSYTHLDVYKRQVLSTRGPGWTDHWCICCRPTAWQSSQVWKG